MDQLLNPAQVCDILGLTPARVQRLNAEGYLETVRLIRLKNGVMPLFDAAQVSALVPQMPRILSRWASEDNARLGAPRAGRTRATAAPRAARLRGQKERFLSSLEEMPSKTADLLRASFYLFHLNHYAKAGHQYLYDLKENVLRAFVRHFDRTHGLEITLVPGEARIRLCPECRSRSRRLGYAYPDYARRFGGCPRCRRERGYYDLYEFAVTHADYRFVFHSPYQTARKWLPDDVSESPRSRRESGHTFGRPVSDPEALAIPLAEVQAELENFLRLYPPA